MDFDLGKEVFIAFNLSLLKNYSRAFPEVRDDLEKIWDKTIDEERKAAWLVAALKAIEVSNGKA